jgi:hypothetical protein
MTSIRPSCDSQTNGIHFGFAMLGKSDAGNLDLWKMLLAESIDLEIHFVTNQKSLTDALRSWKGRVILFSNFPPDETNGFTYSDSKKFFRELLAVYPYLDIHIITNAGGKTLDDHEVLSLSSHARITIQRPWRWLDYPSGFLNCVVQRISESMAGTGFHLKLKPEAANFMKTVSRTEAEIELWKTSKNLCETADPLVIKPDNRNVDLNSFRIWQKANQVPAARKYGEISGD